MNPQYSGIISSLREKIVEIAGKSGDLQAILSIKQEEFLEYPSLETYSKLLKAASRTKNQKEIRAWAMGYLETGNAKPLAPLNKPPNPAKRGYRKFPDYETLVDIAEKEKDPDKVLFWYQEANSKDRHFRDHTQVAKAIGEKYPDTALKIWKSLAERQIALTKPSAYEVAVCYLVEARDIYSKTGREKDWMLYLDGLKETNKKKTRFLQSLRNLTKEKLI